MTNRTIKSLVDDSVITTETFSYDSAGNITDAQDGTFQYDTNNRLVVFNGQDVIYDADGNMLSNGSLCCGYDSLNRLIYAGDHDYIYNAEGVRIRNLCTDEDTSYVYDTNCKLSQLLVKTTNGVTTKYVYGLGLIGEEVNNTFKTYHFDSRGSTIAITDMSRNITDTFAYDTYGKLIARTGESDVIFGYNGRDGVVTDDNGLIYMRARYYSPEMKRFINADIIAGEISNAITLNRFAYANGNPVSFVDPFGLWSWSWFEEKGRQIKDAWNTYVEPAVEKVKNIADKADTDKFRDVLRTATDIGVTSIALVGGVINGYREFQQKGGLYRPASSIASGITKGVATFGAINNAANVIYYKLTPEDVQSDITPNSYSDNGARYINRWDRLDYTKQQTKQSNYNFNARMYYGEYSVHMHVWNCLNLLGLEDTPALRDIAESARVADVEPNDPLDDYNDFMEQDDPKNAILRTAAYFLVGHLGL